MADPDTIYLEPDPGPSEDRMWCADNVWPVDYGEGPSGIRYIRADLHELAVKVAHDMGAGACARWLQGQEGKTVDAAMPVTMLRTVLKGS